MRDEWYGHRNPVTGEPIGDRDEWLSWDFALADAVQTIEDYSDQYGLLAWELDDDMVYVNANRKIHKFKSAIERKTNGKNYKAAPGEYFVPEVKTRGERIQTFQEWVIKESEKDNPVE